MCSSDLREDVGVDLYTVQQQLAKLQMQLESTIKEHADIAAVRVDTESDTVADRARLEQIREQVKVEQRKLAKHQTELDAVTEYYARVRPGCTTKPMTYEERKARREAEIQGLKQALSVLQDETALMQRGKRGSRGHQHFLGVRGQ